MLPTEWSKEVIKLCNSWYKTRPLPEIVSRRLLKYGFVRDSLWYRNEVKPYKSFFMRFVNPNAYAIAQLRKGERMVWKVEMKVLPTNA